MEFDLENPLTGSEDSYDDAVAALFENEIDHSPVFPFDSDDVHVRVSIRQQTFCLISHAQYCYNLDPSITYLAVNYVDRFISKTTIQENKRWIVVCLAISSLSLAAKMRNIDISISLSNMLREESIVMDFQSGIHRMEMLILSTLNWRMRSVTPFSFLNFFLSFFGFQNPSLPQALKCSASQIIFNSHHEVKLLEYKPSIIAASAFLLAIHELIPANFSSFRAGISTCEYIDKEKLLKCLNTLQETLMDGYTHDPCTSTPTSVLEVCTISENGSCSTLSDGHNSKRRRLSDFCTNGSFQITPREQFEDSNMQDEVKNEGIKMEASFVI